MIGYPLSEYQQKWVDLKVTIEAEKSEGIKPFDSKKMRELAENYVREKYPSAISAKKAYEDLKHWYDNAFDELLSSGWYDRKSKKSSKPKRKPVKCSCKKK